MMEFAMGLVVGVLIGAGVVLAVVALRGRGAAREQAAALAQMREVFAALAGEALDANSQRLAQQAAATLDGRKALIDQAVQAVNERLEQVRQALQRIEAERRQDFGHLASAVGSLTTTAGKLHEMLASSKRRGAWGERMAEDVLRLAGLEEQVSYVKQSTDAAAGERERPDFTFLLPNGLRANMDVKFPLERFKAYLDAETDEGRAGELRQLVQAVRNHVRAVAGRGYVDASVPTVPYVIVFIPNEQIYGLVLSAQADLIDEALGQRVVLASPLTLYAMLCVIRQAAEHANIMRTADEVLSLLGEFSKQWGLYGEAFGKVGQRIEQLRDEYDKLAGTRTNMLQRPLDKIEALRSSRGLTSAGGE